MTGRVERLGERRWRMLDRDGAAYLLRPIAPSDATALMRAFEAQAPEDRMMRLMSVAPRLPERAALHFCTVDQSRDVGLVLVPEDDPERLRGGARLMRDREGDAAEYAVSIATDLKGHGFGRRVLEAALTAGREMGVRRVWGSVYRRNVAMRALARTLGMSERADPDDRSLVVTELDLSAWGHGG